MTEQKRGISPEGKFDEYLFYGRSLALIGVATATIAAESLSGGAEVNETKPLNIEKAEMVGVDALGIYTEMPQGWKTTTGYPFDPEATELDYKFEAAYSGDFTTWETDDQQIFEVARGGAADQLANEDYTGCESIETINEKFGEQHMERTDLECLGGYAVTLWMGEVNNVNVTARHGYEPESDMLKRDALYKALSVN